VTSFGQPLALTLAFPWILGCVWFYVLQRRSVSWIDANVAERFRAKLTIYRARSLGAHIAAITLMGLSLVLAMSDPRMQTADALADGGGRVLLFLDASASMYADDIEPFDGETPPAENRFARAKGLARQLVAALPGYEFGLVSYSGEPSLHLPMTADRLLIDDALHFVERHNIYRASGSSLTRVLDTVLRFIDEDTVGFQVVLLGDGELPQPEEYDDALDAVAARDIPVHGITFGSLRGQTRLIYNFQDVVDEKEEKEVLREYTTTRVDTHFEAIADATGGWFSWATPNIASTLAEEIKRTPVRVPAADSATLELAPSLFVFFTALFIWDALVFGRARKAETSFRIYALGEQGTSLPRAKGALLPLLFLVVLCGCSGSRFRAHVENEKGIARDALTQHAEAEPHYLRSIGFNVRPEVPMVNLGRSKTLEGSFAEAHQHLEQAMLLAPELFEAHFNDGVALHEWGASVLDPRYCEVDRTIELWSQAIVRFEGASELSVDDETRSLATANLDFVRASVSELESYRDNPPPECTPPPPPPPDEGSSGGSDEPDPGEQDESDEEDDDEQSPPPPPGREPPPSGGGGDGAEPPPRMSDSELQQIRELIAGLRESRREEGKYYRGSRGEQFSQESWKNPDRVLWW